jgi:hypothetical protein
MFLMNLFMQHSGGRGFLPAFLNSFPLSSRQPFQQPFQPRLPQNARHLLNQRQSRTNGKFAIAVLTGCCLAAITQAAAAQLKAGVARVSINPMEEKIPAQLGGYGAREGKPAEGTLDTIYGKVILFDWGGKKSAVITVDMCSVPICVAEETLNKAGIKGLTLDRMLISASHTHAGLEGFSFRRQVSPARRSAASFKSTW